MKYLTLISLIFYSVTVCSQMVDVQINPGVDTTDTEIKQVIETWKNYLNETDTLGRSYSPYWNEEEQVAYKNYDLLAYEFSQNWYKRGEQSILSVQHMEEDLFKLRIQFYYRDSLTIYLNNIINIYARKINEQYYLENAFTHRTKDWQNKKIGYINYVYPKKTPI